MATYPKFHTFKGRDRRREREGMEKGKRKRRRVGGKRMEVMRWEEKRPEERREGDDHGR